MSITALFMVGRSHFSSVSCLSLLRSHWVRSSVGLRLITAGGVILALWGFPRARSAFPPCFLLFFWPSLICVLYCGVTLFVRPFVVRNAIIKYFFCLYSAV